jgi:hypothetical protein
MADPHPRDLGKALLAVATGHNTTEIPAFAPAGKRKTVTGTYESFRGDVTATVGREGGGLSVTLSTPWGEDAFWAFPESLDQADHEFYAI